MNILILEDEVLAARQTVQFLERAGVVAAAHAGRQGLADGVLQTVLSVMARLGASPARTVAALGPAACGRCYELPAPMADEVEALVPGSRATTRQGTASVDLAAGAEALLHMDKAPQSAIERLVTNSFSAMDQLMELVDEPFSRELFSRLRELLLDGVDPDALKMSPPGMGLVAFDYEDQRIAESTERQLAYIAAYANHEAGDECDRPLLRALLIADVFRFYRPLGIVSSQVGRLVARLYELKHDLPVVGFLPISRAKLEWEQGLIVPPAVSYTPAEYQTLMVRSPGDLTAYHTLSTELALLTLREVERNVDSWERRDDEMREVLRQDPLLNQRQRAILARALRVPDAEFNIRYHKRNHNVAYTTARRDLLELAEKGYLLMEQRGKAFIFVGAPKLQSLVRERTVG